MNECQLIDNARNNPDWDDSLNAELCMGDCDNCQFKEVSRR